MARVRWNEVRSGHRYRTRRSRQGCREMAAAVQAVPCPMLIERIGRRIGRCVRGADYDVLLSLARKEFSEIARFAGRHDAQAQHEDRQSERRQARRTAQFRKAQKWRLAGDHRRVG